MGSEKLIQKSQIHKEKQEIQPTSLDHPMLSIYILTSSINQFFSLSIYSFSFTCTDTCNH